MYPRVCIAQNLPVSELSNNHAVATRADESCVPVCSYFPGHLHAFYLEYVYFVRREEMRDGRLTGERVPGVYSERVQTGGQSYGTIVHAT